MTTKSQAVEWNGTEPLPTEHSILRSIANEMCPFCGRGPWKQLASHTFRAHEVTAYDLREMAGLTRSARICSYEVSEKLSAIARDRWSPQHGDRLAAARGRTRNWSEVGRAHIGAAARRTNAKRAQEKAQALAKRDSEILALRNSGLTYQAIAERVGAKRWAVQTLLGGHRKPVAGDPIAGEGVPLPDRGREGPSAGGAK